MRQSASQLALSSAAHPEILGIRCRALTPGPASVRRREVQLVSVKRLQRLAVGNADQGKAW